MGRAILFVWRHNNDFDSTLPVIYAAARSGVFEAVNVYVSSEDLLWRTDFRIGILDGMPNVRIFDIWQLVGNPIGAAARWLCELSRMSRGPLRKILPKFAKSIISHSRWRKNLHSTLEEINPEMIAFDWVDITIDRRNEGPWGIRTIAEWAKQKRRPFVGLMHGLSLASFPHATSAMSSDFYRLYIESEFRFTQMIASGFPAEKLCIAGSPRFDKFWIDLLGKRIEEYRLSKANSDVKTIVFFATKLVYDYDFERVVDWLNRIAAIPGIRLIVQPHPRGQGKSGFRRLRRHSGCIIDMKTPAAILIREADIVSTLVSSVICEAVALNIPLLYPRFLNSIPTRFDEEGACIVVEGMEDTEAAIKRCLEGGISKDAYERFLNRHVWGEQQSPIATTLGDMRSIIDRME